MRSQMPVEEPFEALIPPVIADKLEEMEQYPNIEVKTSTEVYRISGQPG